MEGYQDELMEAEGCIVGQEADQMGNTLSNKTFTVARYAKIQFLL